MPQLRVQIREWRREPCPASKISVFAPDSFLTMEGRIRRWTAGAEGRPAAETLQEWGVEFVKAFPDCLQEIFAIGAPELTEMIAGAEPARLVPEWNPVLNGSEKSEKFFPRMSAQLLAVVFGVPDAEMKVEPEASAEEEAVEEPGEATEEATEEEAGADSEERAAEEAKTEGGEALEAEPDETKVEGGEAEKEGSKTKGQRGEGVDAAAESESDEPDDGDERAAPGDETDAADADKQDAVGDEPEYGDEQTAAGDADEESVVEGAEDAGSEEEQSDEADEEQDEAETGPRRVVPAEFLGEGRVPPDTAKILETNRQVHETWRGCLLTTQTLLSDFMKWVENFGEKDNEVFGRVRRAEEELRRAGAQATLSVQEPVPSAEISVPVEPPLHMLAGDPTYDYSELCVEFAPFMREHIRRLDLPQLKEWGMEPAPDGSRVVIEDWTQTESTDLRRLADLFHLLRSQVRRPSRVPDTEFDEEEIRTIVATLGCDDIPGVPKCWALAGESVVGLRPVFHYHNGVFDRDELQLCMVLGHYRGQPLPDDLSSQLSRHGTALVWPDGDLLFAGITVKDGEDARRRFHEFVEFGREISLSLTSLRIVSQLAIEECTGRLKILPPRLEVDFERLHRYWRRRRYVAQLRGLVARGASEAARSLVAGVADPEDRNHVRAVYVAEMFGSDPDSAMAELEALPPGGERHEPILAVMESAREADRKDLLGRLFDLWKSIDARVEKYQPDCTPIFELASAGLGLDIVVKSCPDDLAAPVLCDWVNFVMRRMPSTRREQSWTDRVDSLVNRPKNMLHIDLDRLTGLFDTIRRFDLAGRQNVLTAARKKIHGSEFAKYYEKRFGI